MLFVKAKTNKQKNPETGNELNVLQNYLSFGTIINEIYVVIKLKLLTIVSCS